MKISRKELKKVLHYNPETGIFTWRVATARKITVGDRAGTITVHNARAIRVKNILKYEHHWAFFYMTGRFPKKQVDHINGDPSDNRFCNLRLVSASQNLFNTKIQKRNKTGVKGVWFDAPRQKYQVYVRINNRQIRLGWHDNIFDAAASAISGRLKYHGEYARLR